MADDLLPRQTECRAEGGVGEDIAPRLVLGVDGARNHVDQGLHEVPRTGAQRTFTLQHGVDRFVAGREVFAPQDDAGGALRSGQQGAAQAQGAGGPVTCRGKLAVFRAGNCRWRAPDGSASPASHAKALGKSLSFSACTGSPAKAMNAGLTCSSLSLASTIRRARPAVSSAA